MANFRILIADDDEDDYSILTEAFNKLIQHDIKHIKDGQELLLYLETEAGSSKNFPDLILLDINMPKTDGITALIYIRSSSSLAHIPVVMYTTSTDHEHMERCMGLGANGFISKAWGNDAVLKSAGLINDFLQELKKDPFKRFVHNKTL
ncbi:MAG: response regulator receiver protein [Bacteroidetes bacterium]|jgi:CheY-like chemotaxis protein|nr:response regulator receiver protein [Bacteroidota bacterium]